MGSISAGDGGQDFPYEQAVDHDQRAAGYELRDQGRGLDGELAAGVQGKEQVPQSVPAVLVIEEPEGAPQVGDAGGNIVGPGPRDATRRQQAPESEPFLVSEQE